MIHIENENERCQTNTVTWQYNRTTLNYCHERPRHTKLNGTRHSLAHRRFMLYVDITVQPRDPTQKNTINHMDINYE